MVSHRRSELILDLRNGATAPRSRVTKHPNYYGCTQHKFTEIFCEPNFQIRTLRRNKNPSRGPDASVIGRCRSLTDDYKKHNIFFKRISAGVSVRFFPVRLQLYYHKKVFTELICGYNNRLPY